MNQVRYFLGVAEHLNFTRAAEALHVAQPSLTRAIQKLEDELGGLLFRRERSKTHLTELGRMMLPHFTATLEAAEAAKLHAHSFRKRETAQLQVGACSTISAAVAAPILAATSMEMRGLEMSIDIERSAVVEERLAAGELDIAILAPLDDLPERFDLCLIGESRYAVAFAPGHRFEQRREVCLDDLEGEPFIVRSFCHHEAALHAVMSARGLSRIERHRTGDERWLTHLARPGLGCLILPESTCRAGGLAHRVLVDVPFTHRTFLVTVAGRRHSPALSLLVRNAQAASKEFSGPL